MFNQIDTAATYTFMLSLSYSHCLSCQDTLADELRKASNDQYTHKYNVVTESGMSYIVYNYGSLYMQLIIITVISLSLCNTTGGNTLVLCKMVECQFHWSSHHFGARL